MHTVFVYGSLKRGFGNFRLLELSKYLGNHVTEAKYFMHSMGGFPAVYMGGETPIVGEVFEVDDETFQRLDRLEGYPRFYNRTQIPTDYGDAWMYYIENARDDGSLRIPLERLQRDNIETGVWD